MACFGGVEPRGLRGRQDRDRHGAPHDWTPLLTHTDMREAALVMARRQRKLTGTIWPGSHGDMQSHRLTDLTTGQLGKGICPWEVEAEGAGRPHAQMEGLKLEIQPPISSLANWRATHSHGDVP